MWREKGEKKEGVGVDQGRFRNQIRKEVNKRDEPTAPHIRNSNWGTMYIGLRLGIGKVLDTFAKTCREATCVHTYIRHTKTDQR